MTSLVKTSAARSQSDCNDIWGPGGCGDSVALKYSSSSTADLREIHKRNKGTTSHSFIIFHCPLLFFLCCPSLCLSPLSLPLFSHDALTPLSRSRLSSGKFIVGGAYSWSSTTPTCRAKGEHLRYTTGTLISENSSALLCVSLEAREEESTRELCKFKLANFLMEIAVTSEWSCLELKHCCNQYRLSWGWRARTFRSPFVEIMEKTVCYFSQTCRKLADMAGALQVMMLAQRNKYKEERFIKKQTAELCLKLVGACGSQRCWGCIWPTHLETGSLFTYTGDIETETQLSTKAHVKSFVSCKLRWVQLLFLPLERKTETCLQGALFCDSEWRKHFNNMVLGYILMNNIYLML